MSDCVLCPKDEMEFSAFKELIVWLGSQTHKQIIVLRGQAHTGAFDSQSITLGLGIIKQSWIRKEWCGVGAAVN